MRKDGKVAFALGTKTHRSPGCHVPFTITLRSSQLSRVAEGSGLAWTQTAASSKGLFPVLGQRGMLACVCVHSCVPLHMCAGQRTDCGGCLFAEAVSLVSVVLCSLEGPLSLHLTTGALTTGAVTTDCPSWAWVVQLTLSPTSHLPGLYFFNIVE